ncbi:hypothetical protein MIR68_006638 [Amoeboaphelidium protococcarum]|nr:hypothetical protein MIR68_006638 [Amoeboaphelidium protococcarum]
MQDLPPKQGYPEIKIRRNLPIKPISAAVVGFGITLTMIYGLFKVGDIWRERKELKREKLWARLYLLPLFQSEWDREWMKWRHEELEKEREIMKNVEGWTVGQSPYHHHQERFSAPKFDLEGNPVRVPVIRYVDTGEPM